MRLTTNIKTLRGLSIYLQNKNVNSLKCSDDLCRAPFIGNCLECCCSPDYPECRDVFKCCCCVTREGDYDFICKSKNKIVAIEVKDVDELDEYIEDIENKDKNSRTYWSIAEVYIVVYGRGKSKRGKERLKKIGKVIHCTHSLTCRIC